MISVGNSQIKESSISMVITRANGKQEDLGVVSYYNRNPFKLLFWKLRKLINR